MSEMIQKNANLFLARRKEEQIKRLQSGSLPDKSLRQLIDQPNTIQKSSIDQYLSTETGIDTNSEVILEIRKALHRIRQDINRFTPEKRFFITETIDFFNSPTHVGKVIPALIGIDQPDHRVQLLQFVYTTFARLNNNIETIISIPDLFPEASLHAERGGLYSLSMDVARSITGLFKEESLTEFRNHSSDIARVKAIFRQYGIKGKGEARSPGTKPIENFISQSHLLRSALLEFIAQIQTHPLLYLYAQKRHAYYKRFMISVTEGTKNTEPFLASFVLAGCLLVNSQLAPDEALVAAMTSKSKFQLSDTRKLLGEFVDRLAPSTQYDIVNDFRTSVSNVVSGKVTGATKEQDSSVDGPGAKLKKMKRLFKQRFRT